MSCDKDFAKNLVYFFNMFLALLGALMIGFGVVNELNMTIVIDWHVSVMTVAPWVFMTIGAAMVIVALIGCVGIVRESLCLVVSFATYLVMIIIAQVIVAVFLLILDETFRNDMLQKVHGYYERMGRHDVDKTTIAIIDSIQEQFSCCGEKGPEDYGTNETLPLSCCERETSTVMTSNAGPCTFVEAFPGCSAILNKMYQQWNSKPIAGVVFGLACFEVVGAIFAMCLTNSIWNANRIRSQYY